MSRQIYIFIILFSWLNNLYGQEAYYSIELVKNNKQVELYFQFGKPWIGLETATDTINYHDNKILSFTIDSISQDSIHVKKPIEFHYFVTKSLNNSYGYAPSDIPKNSIYLNDFKNDGELYLVYILVDKFHKESFAIKDLTSITYPPKGSETTGCVGCIILPFIPIINILFYFDIRRRWRSKYYGFKEWEVSTIFNNL